jgi:hypothetical protein
LDNAIIGENPLELPVPSIQIRSGWSPDNMLTILIATNASSLIISLLCSFPNITTTSYLSRADITQHLTLEHNRFISSRREINFHTI